jgi:hypothetical protein
VVVLCWLYNPEKKEPSWSPLEDGEGTQDTNSNGGTGKSENFLKGFIAALQIRQCHMV